MPINTNIIAQAEQSIFDIALENYGTCTSIVSILQANGYESLTPDIDQGDVLFMPIADQRVQMLRRLAGKRAATREDVRCSGIGCWRIGDDFKVSENA